VTVADEVPVAAAVAEIQALQLKSAAREAVDDIGAPLSPGVRSRSFAKWDDKDPWKSTLFPNEPRGGPLEDVNLASRELMLSRTDFSLPARGGLGFEFRRSYRSYRRYAGPLGSGWDHNHNQRLVMDARDPANAASVRWYTSSECLEFRREGGGWKPPAGVFAALNMESGEVVIRTRAGLRLVFESAHERPVSGSYWRLVRVTTLHRQGGGWANVMTYRYQPGSDRLLEVTDAFSESIRFGYDLEGRLTEVRCTPRAIRFNYDQNDNLVEVTWPAVALSHSAVCDIREEYAYLPPSDAGQLLERYRPPGATFEYRYEYEGQAGDDPRSVAAVREVARGGAILAEWKISCKEGAAERTVIHRPPAPLPEENYTFDDKGASPSPVKLRLPVAFSLPGRGVSWRYAYNSDGLLTEVVHPSGRRTWSSYHEAHPDPVMRANLLTRRELPAKEASVKRLVEIGVRQEFHPVLPLPTAVRSYEVTTEGATNVLETTVFRYNDSGDEVYKAAGDVRTWTIHTPHGEPAVRLDGTGVATCWDRFEGFTGGTVSLTGGGLVAREVLDADPAAVLDEARRKGLDVPKDIPHRTLSALPLARMTDFTYDASGNLTMEAHPGHRLSYLRNKLGQILGTYDSRADLVLKFLDSSLNVTGQASRCSWAGGSGDYAGEVVGGALGRFHVETFERDARGLLTRWVRSQEAFGGLLPDVRYERYSNGEVFRRRAAGEPALVTVIDPATGFVMERHLEAGNAPSLPLMSKVAYDTEGNLAGYDDDRSQRHTFQTDPFGRPFRGQDPDGVVRESRQDGADRVVSERILDPTGRELDESRYTFDQGGLLLRTERRRLAHDEAGAVVADEWLVQKSNHYDAAGRIVSNRSVHADSTVIMSYDGLGRPIERRLPGGDRELSVYAGDLEIANVREWRNTVDSRTNLLAMLRFYNERQQPWLSVPRPARGTPAFARAQVNRFDTRGRTIMTGQPGQAVREVHYNSLGQARRTVTADEATGTNLIVVTTAFDTAGRAVSSRLENKPLAFIMTTAFGAADRAVSSQTAKWLDIPQVRRFSYDAFGRLETETDPDGMETRQTYKAGSLVGELRRSRGKETESLIFDYDHARRVTSVRADGREIQTFTHDHLGHLVQAVDRCNAERVVTVHRRYDSLGDLLSEKVEMAGGGVTNLPTLVWSNDLARGLATTEIVGGPDDPSFWHRKTTCADGQGRVRSLNLDGTAGFVHYGYDGDQVVQRDLPAAGLVRKAELTPFRELQSERWETASGAAPETFAAFRYHHDECGRLEADDFVMPMPEQSTACTHVHGYDPFGRLSQEGRSNRKCDSREERMRALTKSPAEYLPAGCTECFDYDEAGNRTRSHGLTKSETARASAPEINREGFASLTLLSPAMPFQAATMQEGERAARASPDMRSDRLGSALTADVAGRILRTYEYDAFGRMRRFDSTRDGRTVDWVIEYDPLGRAIRMTGTDRQTKEFSLDLHFASDAFGRRVLKEVSKGKGAVPSVVAEVTVYEGSLPLWVRRAEAGAAPQWQQYLWGTGERETVFAVLSRSRVEPSQDGGLRRYFLHQNRQLDVFASTALQDGRVAAFDIADYAGFGESATFAQIEDVRTHGLVLMQGSSVGKCHDRLLEGERQGEESATRWNVIQGGGAKAVLLTLRHAAKLDELTIWCDSFPDDYRVFVLPGAVSSDALAALVERYNGLPVNDTNVVAWIAAGTNALSPGGRRRDLRPDDPYRLKLGNREGRNILIIWEKEAAASVIEFEVRTSPRPASSLAFASAWLDEETGLYYQGARYRLPEMGGKFISPDPLGFTAGHNLYAYAHNDPLTYYDPDGQFAHILLGAGFGAALGGGAYAVQVWRSGEDWNWTRFAIYSGAGALGGAAAAATFNPVAAAMAAHGFSAAATAVTASSAAGVAGGVVNGFVSQGGITYDQTGDLVASLEAGGKAAAFQGALGALGGAVGGAVLSKVGFSFSGAVASGAAGGAAAGSVEGGIEGYRETGTFSGAALGSAWGAAKGAGFGVLIGAGSFYAVRAVGNLKPLPDQPEGLPDPREGGLLVRTRADREEISYGGAEIQPGYARHHVNPLSLGGTDTRANIRMVPVEVHRQHHPAGDLSDRAGTFYY
jgi:RHS repeat-associated protein